MSERSKTTTSSLSWLFWMILWGCVGYLIYGTTQGAISLAVYSAVTGIILLFGLIPILGVFISFTLLNYVQGWLLNYITASWATSIIFWLGMTGSVLCTVIAFIIILMAVLK